MDELEAVIKIILKSPSAIVRGRLELGKEGAVYGLPARLISLLLLPIPALAIGGAIWQLCFPDWVAPDWFAFVGVAILFNITGVAFLFVLFRRKHRPPDDV